MNCQLPISSQGSSTGVGLLGSTYINLTRIIPDSRGGGMSMTASTLRMSSSWYDGKARRCVCLSLVVFVCCGVQLVCMCTRAHACVCLCLCVHVCGPWVCNVCTVWYGSGGSDSMLIPDILFTFCACLCGVVVNWKHSLLCCPFFLTGFTWLICYTFCPTSFIWKGQSSNCTITFWTIGWIILRPAK